MSIATFADALAEWAGRQPDKTAVVDANRRLTYAELDAQVDAVVVGLQRRGFGPGDVVSSQLPNCIESMVLCFAATRIGALHNPIVTIYREREVEFIRRQAESAMFVNDPADDVVHGEPNAQPEPRDVDPDAPRFLLYTSGSTADPKGALHSDTTLLAECRAQAEYHGMTSDEVFVMPSPVAHVSGLLYGILLPVLLGAKSVLMPAWDPTRFLELVEAEGGTFCGGATPFLQGVVEHPHLDRYDLSSFRLFPCGGADVPPELIRAAMTRLNIRSGRGYGSTEFPSITSSAGPGEPDHKRAETDGRPIGANEVRINDGEIEARGPELFLGYRDAALDADAFTVDGWLRTGDLGFLDDEGYLTVTGRLKDIVVRSGEKISAREIEDLLHEHPKVRSVAVVAVPDARTGERGCACVVPIDAASPPSLAELTEFLLTRQISLRKLPEQIDIVAELPMTASGKVKKHELRARLTNEAER
ncbi:MAG: cyclohexanecarboxylate-CoA ligase [Acidimicrobiia bacterium]|nr:cyclohexanecarboxylate-CoA ligase [Acidimicrobiia bacterium]